MFSSLHAYLVAESCPTLCDPMDYSLPISSVLGIFQARILEWVAISCSRGSSPPRDQTHVSCIGRQILFFFFGRQILYHCAGIHIGNVSGFHFWWILNEVKSWDTLKTLCVWNPRFGEILSLSFTVVLFSPNLITIKKIPWISFLYKTT